MNDTLRVQCVISGGGPAGIMLGYLLARAGIEVAVLEKWPDFFRDFRGDTIHPSTMNILRELGLLEKFLALPHQETSLILAHVGHEEIALADFSKTRLRTPYIAFIPQWDFLTFMSKEAQAYPEFHLLMATEAMNLIEEGDRVVGVRAKGANGEFEVRADLVVGADGRHSTVREKAGFQAKDLGAPMDVLWFRLSRDSSDPKETFGAIDEGHFMILIERGDYWQCGFVIPKGGFDRMKGEGIENFRAYVRELAPFLRDRTTEIRSWDDVKMLVVTVDRLDAWAREGVLCIGDAAHAMSPIGGVGINLAIQDAVAAANILIPALRAGIPPLDTLRAVQKRRTFAVRTIQHIQVLIQNKLIARVFGSHDHPNIPVALKLLRHIPLVRSIPPYLIGIGVRPEHVRAELLQR